MCFSDVITAIEEPEKSERVSTVYLSLWFSFKGVEELANNWDLYPEIELFYLAHWRKLFLKRGIEELRRSKVFQDLIFSIANVGEFAKSVCGLRE